MDARERLIGAAQELLWERGYVGTSPKAIQRTADAGQGSMYHHFTGKQQLAEAAITRSADQLKAEAEECFAAGTAADKIARYLTRQRDVLRGCRIGRLTADPDIMAIDDLRQPLADTFTWLQVRLAGIIRDGGLPADPDALAATIVAVVQGGYVLARAADEPGPFEQAVSGLLALLR
jgi:AcrR family transcriptional regulator